MSGSQWSASSTPSSTPVRQWESLWQGSLGGVARVLESEPVLMQRRIIITTISAIRALRAWPRNASPDDLNVGVLRDVVVWGYQCETVLRRRGDQEAIRRVVVETWERN